MKLVVWCALQGAAKPEGDVDESKFDEFMGNDAGEQGASICSTPRVACNLDFC